MKFQDFARVWTPVAFSRDVARKPVALKVAGEPIVLYRTGQGELHALIDRCPHRGVALSLGKITPEGRLQCPFHGWEFDGTGVCQHQPFNDLPEAKRSRYRTGALKVLEQGGLIWIFTAPMEEAPERPDLPDNLTDPAWFHRYVQDEWKAHWTRAMENMLDYPHLPYIHRRTIGRGLVVPARQGAKIALTIEEQPTGMRIISRVGEADTGGWLEWWRPNGMRLNISQGKVGMYMHVWCVPVDENHTRMLVVSSRNFGKYNPFFVFGGWINRLIISEDRAVVESSSPVEVPEPVAELSVGSDKPTLAFRRHYLHHMKGTAIDTGKKAPRGGHGTEAAAD